MMTIVAKQPINTSPLNNLFHLHGGHDDDGIVQYKAEAGQYTGDGQEANVVKGELGRLNELN